MLVKRFGDCRAPGTYGGRTSYLFGLGGLSIALDESVYPSFRVNNFLLTGVVRMAAAANFNANLRLRRAYLHCVAANTGGNNFIVLRMNTFLHLKTCINENGII